MAALGARSCGFVALAETPFYLEAGGQVSDVGTITGSRRRGRGDRCRPRDRMAAAARRAGAERAPCVRATSSPQMSRRAVRDATRRNHTATHLLHAALRQVLGSHVKQSGSLVAPDRLRFDFVHFSALDAAGTAAARSSASSTSRCCATRRCMTDVKGTQEAMASGAMALFGEKYGDRVRVVSVPGFSMELCGGTHVRATGDIGLFAIVSEGGVAAGVRRIEAITGLDSLRAFQRRSRRACPRRCRTEHASG